MSAPEGINKPMIKIEPEWHLTARGASRSLTEALVGLPAQLVTAACLPCTPPHKRPAEKPDLRVLHGRLLAFKGYTEEGVQVRGCC